MEIAIVGSMAFAKEMLVTKATLEKKGHKAFVSDFVKDFLGKTEREKEKLNRRNVVKKDAIKEFWHKIKKCDAILVLNYKRKGINGYIGGNALMEIGLAHVLNKKIFLLHPIPNIPFYKAEIEGVKPNVLGGDLAKITSRIK